MVVGSLGAMVACGEREVGSPEFAELNFDEDAACVEEYGEEWTWDPETGECYQFILDEEEGGGGGGSGGGGGCFPDIYCLDPLSSSDIQDINAALNDLSNAEMSQQCDDALQAFKDVMAKDSVFRGNPNENEGVPVHDGLTAYEDLPDGTTRVTIHFDADFLDSSGNEDALRYGIIHEGLHAMGNFHGGVQHPQGSLIPNYPTPFDEVQACVGWPN
jgi:hypothetical protein